MQFNMNMPFRDFTSPYAVVESKLEPEMCDKIIELGKSKTKVEAENFQGDGTSAVTDKRICNVCSIGVNDSQEIFYTMTAITSLINEDMYKFDLTGFIEDLQFIEYIAPNGHYTKHVDKGYAQRNRKLTVVALLSDENDYEGGDLELYFSDTPIVVTKKRGTIVTFPSYVLHRVTPVTKGTRYSLVGWASGPNFR